MRPMKLLSLQRLSARKLRRSKVAGFVVGCQRSGTTMLLRVLSRSRYCKVYHENNAAAFDETFRLRDPETIRRLIAGAAEPVVVFKPLLDSQHTLRLLDQHSHAKAIWLYRHYRDAVGSAVEAWGPAHRDIVLGIATDTNRHEGQPPIAGGLNPALRSQLASLCHDGLSTCDGSLLHWYVRNRLYVDLANDPRVMLVKYEEMVARPTTVIRSVFELLRCPFSIEHTETVHGNSVGRHSGLDFDPDIEQLAVGLLRELDEYHAADARLSRSDTSSHVNCPE